MLESFGGNKSCHGFFVMQRGLVLSVCPVNLV